MPKPDGSHSPHTPESSSNLSGLDRYHADRVELDRELTDRVIRAHSVMTAALAEILDAVTQAEEAETYWAQGAQSTGEWLAANLRVHGRTARMWSRTAKQLRDFPAFRQKMAAGQLGIDQVRQLLKYVEPADHVGVAEAAVFDSAEDLESNARSERRVTPDRVEQVRSERWYEEFFDHEELKYSFRGEITGQDGLVVHRAMQLLAWNAPEEPVYDLPRHPEQRLADAFVEMASNALANTSDHDIATVVVHADADKLHMADRVGVAEFGTDVPMEAIRRLTCDGRLQLVAHADDGCVLGVGRVTRSIPPWLRRLVRARDRGCRFPGCRRTYWTQIHHIIHWAYGGPTELHNLVTLCGFHHRMLHEDQWTVRGDPAGELAWLLPGGTPYQRTPGYRPWELIRQRDLEDIEKWASERLDLVKPGPG